MYSEVEREFNVVYPENENATYVSLLNYSSEGENPFQRWYRYKRAFLFNLLKK